ncbi:MAG: hypothetical protein EBY22_17625, partial [Gammaproteobacteria bacterium]|nr:hypothetical protein [Gammaproteobacteria bacterium]
TAQLAPGKISKLTTEQLKSLPIDQIRTLTPQQIFAFNARQISQFSTTQAAAFTEAKNAALAAQKAAAIDAAYQGCVRAVQASIKALNAEQFAFFCFYSPGLSGDIQALIAALNAVSCPRVGVNPTPILPDETGQGYAIGPGAGHGPINFWESIFQGFSFF